MNIEIFYRELETLFSNRNLNHVKEFLDETLKQVNEEQEITSRLIVLNECLGFYQSVGLSKEIEELENRILLIYPEALPVYEDMVKEKEYYLLSIYETIANLLAGKGEFKQSSELIKKSVRVLEIYEGTENKIASAYTNLTVNYLRSSEIEKARETIEKAMAIYEQMEGEKPEGYGIALTGLAEVYYMKKEYINAIATYKNALDEIRKHYGESPIYAHALENCAKICFDAGYGEDAQSLLEHAQEIRSKNSIE